MDEHLTLDPPKRVTTLTVCEDDRRFAPIKIPPRFDIRVRAYLVPLRSAEWVPIRFKKIWVFAACLIHKTPAKRLDVRTRHALNKLEITTPVTPPIFGMSRPTMA